MVSPAITCDFVFFFPLVGSFLPDRLGVLRCMTRMSVQPIRRFLKQNTLARQGRFSFKMHFKTEESGATAYIRT